MSTRRELISEKASEYQDEVMKDNPDGFHVSTYCNADMLANAFEEGWEAADKNPIEYKQFRLETDEIIMKLQSQLSLANEKLKKMEHIILESRHRHPSKEFCDIEGTCYACWARNELTQLQSAEATGGEK